MSTGEQQTNLENLITDLLEIKSTAGVKQWQKDKLKSDVKRLLKNAQPPDPDLSIALLKDFKDMIVAGSIDRDKLKEDLDAVIASAHIDEGDANAVKADLILILNAADISQSEKDTVIGDLEAIIATAQANHNNDAVMRQR